MRDIEIEAGMCTRLFEPRPRPDVGAPETLAQTL